MKNEKIKHEKLHVYAIDDNEITMRDSLYLLDCLSACYMKYQGLADLALDSSNILAKDSIVCKPIRHRVQ